jgi:hypothetical protein
MRGLRFQEVLLTVPGLRDEEFKAIGSGIVLSALYFTIFQMCSVAFWDSKC